MSWSSKLAGVERQNALRWRKPRWEEAAASSGLAQCLLKLRTCINFAYSFGCAKKTGYIHLGAQYTPDLENGCPNTSPTTEAKSMEAVAKWTVALVPLYHGGRILHRSVNGCYLLWYFRREAEWNRVTSDRDWMYPTRNFWRPICYHFWPTTSEDTAWSRHPLSVFNLGRSPRGVWCTGNVHNSNCCRNFGHWGVSFFAKLFYASDDHSFFFPLLQCRASLILALINLVLITPCLFLALSVSSVITAGLTATCNAFTDGLAAASITNSGQ